MKIHYFLSLLSILATAAAVAEAPKPLAPGYSALPFKLAAPGSYTLPVIAPAGDGEVLNADSQAKRLHALMGDKLVLLSFIYATCSDISGCPLATQVLHKISRQLQKQPELASKLRLLTLSFNPQHDTPEMMRRYGEGFKTGGFDWQFLTTGDEQKLQPILDAYQQNVKKIYDDQGRFTGTFSHLLRVYLIDTDKQIRNIYNVDFLHADTVLNDVKTLLAGNAQQAVPQPVTAELMYQAGDNKTGYEQADYRTHSIALKHRRGQAADLLHWAQQPPLGLPPLPQPADNPISAEKIALGRQLFYDRRLSLNNTFSCAMCHIPEQGFTSNEMATAVGIEGRSVRRNSPTLFNVGYYQALFDDGRESSLEQQIWGPLLAHNEMANPSIGYVLEKIRADQDYPKQFQAAFKRGPGMETVGMALASYERSLNSANSPFDRWYYGKHKQALSVQAVRGFKLFTGKAGCASCHSIQTDHALFTDQGYHNTGIGYADSMGKDLLPKTLQIAPGLIIPIDNIALHSVAQTKENDLGRYEITQQPQHRWQYKTPSLRNIALTAPYMHNGAMATLKDVLAFYNRGGIDNENLDPLLKPLHLSEAELDELLAFLQALTGDNVEALVADAFAAPVGDSD